MKTSRVVNNRNDAAEVLTGSASGKHSLRTQRGDQLISVIIVLFVMAALLTLYVERQTEHGRLERGEQMGYALSLLGEGFDAYIDANRMQLAAAVPTVQGVVDPLHPTAKELIGLMGIKGVTPTPPVLSGASYQFQVKYPAGCTASQKLSEPRCRPGGLAYIDKPLMHGSKVDYVALARAARTMRGRGGYSRLDDPSHFAFLNSATHKQIFALSNPVNQAGVLAWRADTSFTADSGSSAESLRIDGTNRMNATLRLDGNAVEHDLAGVNNITASGKVFSKEIEVEDSALLKGNISVERNSSVEGNETINQWLEITNRGLWTTNALTGGTATVAGWLDMKGRGVWTTDLNVSSNAVILNNFYVNSIGTDILNFSTRRSIYSRCTEKLAMGMSNNGDPSRCNQYGYWNKIDIKPFDFIKTPGFLKEFFPPN